MTKLLIICDVYPPSFAPRMGYLVKYMKDLGWTADVVTRAQDKDFSFKSLLGDEKVMRVNGIKIPMRTVKDKVARLLNQKKTHKKNAKLISNYILNTLNANDYKLILCSTAHRTFILESACTVANYWNKPWIVDIRDIEEQQPKVILNKRSWSKLIINILNKNFIKFNLRKRNKRLQETNAIVTISPWHLEQLKKYNVNVHLIYNGYCPDHFFPRSNQPQQTFKVTYMGLVISNEYRDPTLLFLAVKKLYDEEKIDERFRIQFFTPSYRREPILENSAYDDIRHFVDFFEYVDTSAVPQILADSSLLLLLTNLFKDDGPKGIMTTKYFEYLAMERPILCIRSDENLLESSVNEANAGLAGRTVEEVYDFLLEKWNEWKVKGFTTANINREYTQQFSRKLQAKQFVDLFNQLSDK